MEKRKGNEKVAIHSRIEKNLDIFETSYYATPSFKFLYILEL